MPPLLLFFKSLLIAAVVGLLAFGLFVYSGLYPVGADVPHTKATYWLLETARERSIARAASDINIPDNINNPSRLLTGGADYNDMCAGCHLKPGKKESDLTIGLYPSPPDLTEITDIFEQQKLNKAYVSENMTEEAIQRQFWIIKHGIKGSGMPACGPTHSDERIWNMVAFLQQLPSLSEEEYQILTARGDATEMHDH